jgi:hypothetical protein
MLTCPLCNTNVEKLADSHVFPLALAKEMMDGTPLVRLNANQGRLGDVRKGISVRVICANCEADSQVADQELIRFSRELGISCPIPSDCGREVRLSCDVKQLQLACMWMFYRYALSQRREHLIVEATPHRMHKLGQALRGERNPFRSGLQAAITHRSDAFGQCVIASPRLYSQDARDYFAFDIPKFVVAVSDGYLPKSLQPYKLKSECEVVVASFPMPDDEVAEAMEAVGDAGGLEGIEDFFESPRGKRFRR